jgi:hypothetical protein
MQKFLNTAAGSYLKVFITIVIGMVITHGSIWGINWKDFANTAVISFLPIIINALNPKDPRYGAGKENL